MDDIFSIIEKIDKKIHHNNIKNINYKVKKNTFNLNDFQLQINNIKKLGGINYIMDILPLNYLMTTNSQNSNKKKLIKMEAIINSMTILERNTPGIIKGSRKKRIAKGSVTTIQDVNTLLKHFKTLKNIMKK